MGERFLTVVELPEFARMAERAGMSEEERSELVDLLAIDPAAGVSLGGGLYKVRFARKGRGKSGGYRVLYFYKKEDWPVVLLTAFGKNQKGNLSPRELADLIEICSRLSEQFGSSR